MTARPLPLPDDVSAPYWQAAANHVLTVARCSNCNRISLPPGSVCDSCGSTTPNFVFTPVAGTGAVRSWTVVRQSFLPGFDVPFVLVDVELDDQSDLRLVARLMDGPDAALAIGAKVRVTFEDLTPEVAVPAFELADSR